MAFAEHRIPVRSSPIAAITVLSIVILGAIAVWDERRESAAALDDFAAEQAVLARSVAHDPKSVTAIEEPGSIVALFKRGTTLTNTAGESVHCAAIENAHDEPWARLSREEAAAVGLPARMAIAGIARVDADVQVAVIATALRVRDRQSRAMWRLVLGLALTAGVIGGLGILAHRKQLRLAVSEAMQERDERLVRADKLATMGALATGIAHEVSTPLGVIVGRAEQLLPKVAADERATKSVNVIAEQAERITRIVRSFLRLARGGTPSLEKVPPEELAKAALELVEHRFEKAGVALTHDIGHTLPPVAVDPKLVEQVLVNLLLNACDAGATTVELAVRTDAEHVAFVVTDDGEGITPSIAERAKEPFFTTKSEERGTGLGLAIANEIVKHHHGELTLTPRTDAKGTRATVHLAAAKENDG
jgi:signal transduction histidine kinase